MKELKFIHISDINLGALPDKGQRWSSDRRSEIKETLNKTIKYAKEKQTDIIFISGDLFSAIPEENQVKELDRMFGEIKDTAIVYLSGKNDYIDKDSFINNYTFSSNLYVLGARSKNKSQREHRLYGEKIKNANVLFDGFVFNNLGVAVYGVDCDKTNKNIFIPEDLRVDDNSFTNILMAYGNVDSKQLQIKLKKKGFSYFALGGHGSYEMISKNMIYYPGSLEPLSVNEPGKHGFVEGFISDGKVNAKFTAISKRQYKNINYPVTKYMTSMEIAEDISRLIQKEGEENIYSINLLRANDCEKSFDVDTYMDFNKLNIADIAGQEYDKDSFETFIRANKNNKFSLLLNELYASDPLTRDAAKMAVDMIIDLSGVHKRKSNKIYDKNFEECKNIAIQRLTAKRTRLMATEKVADYEAALMQLEVNSDVAEKLNQTWAKERQMELELLAAKDYLGQIPSVHSQLWRRNGMRFAILPFIIFILACFINLPYLISKGAHMGKDSSAWIYYPIVGVIVIVLSYMIGFFAARFLDSRGKNFAGKICLVEELDLAKDKVENCTNKLNELRKKRRNYQTLQNQRKELLEEVNEKERRAEKVYYNIKRIDKILEMLK